MGFHSDNEVASSMVLTQGYECGADFVKTTLTPPKNHDKLQLKKMCSFDGDADRVVFWYLTDGRKIFNLNRNRM